MSRRRKIKAPVLAVPDESDADDDAVDQHWINTHIPIGYGYTPLSQLQCVLPLAGFVRVRVEYTEPHDVYVLRFGCGDDWTLEKVRERLLGVFSEMGYQVARKELLVWLVRHRVKAAVCLPRRGGRREVQVEDDDDAVEY